MGKKVNGLRPYDPGIKSGVLCKVTKVFKKEGKKSGIPLGIRIMKIARKPTVGDPLYALYEGEHYLSGDPKIGKFAATSTILKIHKIRDMGLSIETETSVLIIEKI